MWVRNSAIRPVSEAAKIPIEALYAVESWLCVDDAPGDEDLAEERLNDRFEMFELAQPALAAHVGDSLNRTRDDLAIALGYFLALIIWLAFEETFDDQLEQVDEFGMQGVVEAVALDEQLRRSDPAEQLETDDVIAMEQPAVLPFIHEHIETALEAHAELIDVDAVNRVYRLLLEEILALSYAVRMSGTTQSEGQPEGEALSQSREIYA